jgi:hypothetical protein
MDLGILFLGGIFIGFVGGYVCGFITWPLAKALKPAFDWLLRKCRLID